MNEDVLQSTLLSHPVRVGLHRFRRAKPLDCLPVPVHHCLNDTNPCNVSLSLQPTNVRTELSSPKALGLEKDSRVCETEKTLCAKPCFSK